MPIPQSLLAYCALVQGFCRFGQLARGLTRIRNRQEAGAGIEPANSGFADRDLTTWLPRRLRGANYPGLRCECQRALVIRSSFIQRFSDLVI